MSGGHSNSGTPTYPWGQLAVDQTAFWFEPHPETLYSAQVAAHMYWKRRGGRVATVSFYGVLIVTRVQ